MYALYFRTSKIFRCSTMTKTRRFISGSSCDKKAGASRVQDFKKRNLTLLIICLLTCIVYKNYIMYTCSCTSNDYCLLYVNDIIAASTCDLLCKCFFGNKFISYKKNVQFYFCRYICLYS